MACPDIGVLSKTLTFTVTAEANTGAPVDADALPTYKVYEDETQSHMLSGTMNYLDPTNTTGLYSEQITLSAANGFEADKTYTIHILAAIGGVSVQKSYTFTCWSTSQADDWSDTGNAAVLAVVNARLNRTETSISTQLRAALREITGRGDFLAATEDAAIVQGDGYISYPTDFKALDRILIDDNELEEAVFEDIMPRDADAAQEEPTEFAPFNRRFYLNSVSNAAYTAVIYYYRYHPGDVSSILLEDEFLEAVYCLTTAKVAAAFDLDEKAAKWYRLYEREMPLLMAQEPKQVKHVQYHDI